jgi:hypothetical protein
VATPEAILSASPRVAFVQTSLSNHDSLFMTISTYQRLDRVWLEGYFLSGCLCTMRCPESSTHKRCGFKFTFESIAIGASAVIGSGRSTDRL